MGQRYDRCHRFEAWARDQGWTQTTVDSYSLIVASAAHWLHRHGVRIDTATTGDLTRWQRTRSPDPGTRLVVRHALAAYYRSLDRADNPASRLPSPRQRRRLPRALTSDQAARIVRSAYAEGGCWPAYVGLLLYAGLRRDEARLLAWAQVNAGWVRVRGKGDRDRVVPLHPDVRQALHRWGPGAGWVFPSPRQPGPIGTTCVGQHLRAIGVRVGVPGLHAHMLRHTAATGLLDAGANVRVVQEFLGHADLATTAGYLACRPAAVADAVARLDFTA